MLKYLLPENIAMTKLPAPDNTERLWLAKHVPGKVFWDIGACVGTYTLTALHHQAKMVVAVEPVYENLEHLLNNVIMNDLPTSRLVMFNKAVSNEVGTANFNMGRYNAGSLAKPGRDKNKKYETREVLVTTLDQLMDHCGPPDIIKIDANGYEALVLQGGPLIFNVVKPLIICKFDNDNHGLEGSQACYSSIPKYYKWYSFRHGELDPNNLWHAKTNHHMNQVAIPYGDSWL